MSNNWFMFLIFVYMGAAMLNAVVEGTSALVSTELTATVNTTNTTVSVRSTEGFRSSGVVIIEGDALCYTGRTATTFTGVTQGTACRRNNEANTHLYATNTPPQVQSEAPGIINTLVGFDVMSVYASGSGWDMFVCTFMNLGHLPDFIGAIARMLLWDYPGLFSGPYEYIRYLFLFVFSAGMVMGFVRLARGG